MHNRFREVRKNAGLALRPFGEKIGIGATSVQRIEAGINNPSEQTIRAICSEFNVNRHWLETGEGEPYVREPSPADLINQIAAEHGYGPGGLMFLRTILRIFDELGPDELDRIIAQEIPGIMAEMHRDPTATAAERAEPIGGDSINDNSL